MQLNPNTIIEKKILMPSKGTKVQQVGIDCTLKETVTIPAHGFVNVAISEQIALPSDIWCYFYIRSSLSRQGLTLSCGVYDPGFHGTSGFALHNDSDRPITIEQDSRVAQALFFAADSASVYQGKYNQAEAGIAAYKTL